MDQVDGRFAALDRISTDVGDDDDRAFGGEAHGDRPADPGAAAGDDRDASVEKAHPATICGCGKAWRQWLAISPRRHSQTRSCLRTWSMNCVRPPMRPGRPISRQCRLTVIIFGA